VQGFKGFTHRFSISGSRHFLIDTDVLPTYDQTPERFVVLAGNLEWARRHVAFDEASLIVVPSRSEPFGMVILEAMLSGVPVVCSRDAGALEHVEVAATFDWQDPDAGAAHVTRLLNDESSWLEAVEKQRTSVDAYVASAPHTAIQDLWRRHALVQ
jgi:glycosyltransferase involved in cell wall biosynthesis